MAYDPRRFRSASQLKLWTDCGEAYRLRKVEKFPGKPAAWTVRGIAVHSAIEAWERSNREIDPVQFLEDIAWPLAFEATKDSYPDLDNWIRTPNTKSTARDLELRRKESPEHVKIYCDRAVAEEDIWRVWNAPLPKVIGAVAQVAYPTDAPAVEVEFKLYFDNVIVVGWIDQIIEWFGGEAYTVKDIKSGKDTKEDYRQLKLYAVAANAMFNLGIEQGTYWYTKLDRDCGMIDLSTYTMADVEADYTLLDTAVKQEIFLPNPDRDKCLKFCGVQEYCKEWK